MKTNPFGPRALRSFLLPLAAVSVLTAESAKGPSIINVSYDVSREFYKEYNALYAASRKSRKLTPVEVQQSHGGSTKQANAVIDGLEADVLTLNQALDVDKVAEKGLVSAEWRKAFPQNASPFYSTMVILVRKGNPKNIRDFADLVKPGVSVVLPNPKTTGNGRYTVLAVAGALKKAGADDAQIRKTLGSLIANTPYLAPGGRDASTAFRQRGQGDALVTFESEVRLLLKEDGGSDLEAVAPAWSVRADLPVAVIDKVAAKKGTTELAKDYLTGLYGADAQALGVKHGLRPTDAKVAAAADFAPVKLFSVEETFGSWSEVKKTFFADKALIDQLLAVRPAPASDKK